MTLSYHTVSKYFDATGASPFQVRVRQQTFTSRSLQDTLGIVDKTNSINSRYLIGQSAGQANTTSGQVLKPTLEVTPSTSLPSESVSINFHDCQTHGDQTPVIGPDPIKLKIQVSEESRVSLAPTNQENSSNVGINGLGKAPTKPNFSATISLLEEPVPPTDGHREHYTLKIPGMSWVRLHGQYHMSAEKMRDLEMTYLKSYPYMSGPQALSVQADLRHRYVDSRSNHDRVHESISKFAAGRGIDLSCPKELAEGMFSSSSGPALKKSLTQLADQFFLNKNASHNPLKAQLAREQTERFIDLLDQAKKDGSLADGACFGLTNEKVYQLVARNLGALAIQDEAACENNLGDHGVRHLVGHNIRICETLADKLSSKGTKVTAMDRLIMHQAMIMHDVGYSVQNVRGSLNKHGVDGQELGHPILAAKYMREVTKDGNDPLALIFKPEDFELLHRCVLYHDLDSQGKGGLDFRKTENPTFDDRRANLESMVRMADNSHAFEDKLPELLYRHPKALQTIRVLKTAQELNLPGVEKVLRNDLRHQIEQRADLSDLDKKALYQAVETADGKTVKFSVRRILANDPTFDISPDGKLQMNIEEAKIHSQISQAFGLPSYGLLGKYIQDISDANVPIDATTTQISTPHVDFNLKLGKNKAGDLTEYQATVAKAFTENPDFQSFVTQDTKLGKMHTAVQATLEKAPDFDDAHLRRFASKYVGLKELPSSRDEILARIEGVAQQIRDQRQSLLNDYMLKTFPDANASG